MCSEIKRLKLLSECQHLNKTDRDAIKWALESLGEGKEGVIVKAQQGYPDEFEWIWTNKPEREGSNPKKQAYSACTARVKEGATWRDLAEGVKRYKHYCDAKHLTGTDKVQQMATFFGTKEGFKESWGVTLTKPETPKQKLSPNAAFKQKMANFNYDFD